MGYTVLNTTILLENINYLNNYIVRIYKIKYLRYFIFSNNIVVFKTVYPSTIAYFWFHYMCTYTQGVLFSNYF